jgi:hypothetical protein
MFVAILQGVNDAKIDYFPDGTDVTMRVMSQLQIREMT